MVYELSIFHSVVFTWPIWKVSTKVLDLTKWYAASYQRPSFKILSVKVIAKEKDSIKSQPWVITGS
jgi:hypothetical protein